jgi:hypothetical protein
MTGVTVGVGPPLGPKNYKANSNGKPLPHMKTTVCTELSQMMEWRLMKTVGPPEGSTWSESLF